MRQLEDCYWIAMVEAGDTPETIGHWIEDNLVKELDRGSVDTEMWVVNPKEGDLIIFNAPDGKAMLRYPDFIGGIPKFASLADMDKMADDWFNDEDKDVEEMRKKHSNLFSALRRLQQWILRG